MNKYHKSCFSLISPFNGLLQHYDLKFSENSYLRQFSAQVSQIVFLAYLTFFTTFYNCMTWNVRKLISPPFQCTSITNRVFAYLTVLQLITTLWPEMSENSYLRHFSAQSITKRFLSLFDRFTTYYNCMTWNVRKLISPPFQCTSITNRVIRLFHPLMAYYNIMILNFLKTHISAISVHKYHKSCS